MSFLYIHGSPWPAPYHHARQKDAIAAVPECEQKKRCTGRRMPQSIYRLGSSEPNLKSCCLVISRDEGIECYGKFARLRGLPASITQINSAHKCVLAIGERRLDLVFPTLCHVALDDDFVFGFDVQPRPDVIPEFCAGRGIDFRRSGLQPKAR